ncbi:MAG TPA: helix-turn-helix domain-containing protein [Acidimicrobiales bacterium]|nr:helix-turn-helix domain-containing protein [Acidimicrobiales bacterium]
MEHAPLTPPLTADEFAAAVTAVTSAFGDPTRREIYVFAHGAQRGVTAAEVAERFDLHPNVARHHLDKLAAGGYLEVAVERHSPAAGAGRPSKRYRASDKEMGLEFPARRDDLLVKLLGRALALVPREAAEAMAEEVGIEYGRSLAASMSPSQGHRSLQVALHAVADALTAHGFAAHTDARGGSLAIIAEQCPFGTAAEQHPVICAVDRGIVKGMLSSLYGDTVPETSASRPQGDEVCVTLV